MRVHSHAKLGMFGHITGKEGGKGGGEDHIHHPPVTQSCGGGGKTERKYSFTHLQERRKKHGTFVASAVWRKEKIKERKWRVSHAKKHTRYSPENLEEITT